MLMSTHEILLQISIVIHISIFVSIFWTLTSDEINRFGKIVFPLQFSLCLSHGKMSRCTCKFRAKMCMNENFHSIKGYEPIA